MDQIRKRRIFLNQLNQDLQIEFNLNSTPLNATQIEDIARLNPVKISDLEAITGIGSEFLKKYGELIVSRLQNFNSQSITLNQSSHIQTTINELKKRLINISKRNRLLYVAKTSPKTTFDLSELGANQLHQLLFESKKIKLVDLKEDASKQAYQSLNDIHKNASRAYRETGNFDLYVATPFVMGEFISDGFTVRAPLALFPVKMDISNQSIHIQMDLEKDVLINTNLIIAAQNFLKTNQPLIPMNLEEVNPDTFLDDLLVSYKQQGLDIEHQDHDLKPFEPKTIDSFKDLKPGIFEVEHVALLGYFPILSTSIQRDYAQISQLDSFVPHVLTLLETLTQSHDEEDAHQLDEVVFNEQHLAYINPLNSSQEQAQLQIKKGQHIVIQGPPGTGKSQTISNVIAQSVFDKKNVLMVSEKKAAIDVVYSRLGILNEYALIIDNINDKQNFYRQCERLFTDKNIQHQDIDLSKQNQAMNDLIAELGQIKSLLTTPLIDDLNALDLYPIIKKIDYSDSEVFKDYQFLKENVDSKSLTQYKLFKELTIPNDFDQIIDYLHISQTIPDMNNINKNLSDYDVMVLKQALPDIRKKLDELNNQNIVVRLLSKSKEAQILEPLTKLKKTIVSNDLNHVELILNNYPLVSQPLNFDNNINDFLLIDKIRTHFNESPHQALDRLVNFIGFEHLQNFENSNRQIHGLINSYDQLVASFNASANEKSDQLVDYLAKDLYSKRFELKSSKRAMEMKRIIERKRKWSISKFVDKFYVELFDGIKIWLATPDVVSEIFPLKADLFDVLIFDEASQLYIEKAIPSILRSKQVVIAGDSQQLRPSAFGVGRYGYDEDIEDEFIDSTAALDEESLLDLARFKYPSTVLNYHYRSLYEELIAYSNAAFYKNQLIVSPNAFTSQLPPIKRIKVEDGQWIKRSNQAESTAVVNLIKDISQTRQQDETIGVITFNATQRNLIEKDLETLANQDKEFNDFYQQEINRSVDNQDLSLFVKNIENVQGDERDIIIFSITYAPDESGKVPSFFGWLSQQGGQNRLNVAITRAKKQIYVVTSIEPHQLPVSNASALGPSLLRDYLIYSKAISEQDEAGVQTVLNQLSPNHQNQTRLTPPPLTQVVMDTLNKEGYTCHYQYGIGQFTIECAVFKDDQVICGFEFDQSVYPRLKENDRGRDIHQPNYLKVRGWNLHRLFAYHYYHHPQSFLENVVNMVNQYQSVQS